jgi:carbon storage regulator
MLVITRKLNERIMIETPDGREMEIVIVQIKGKQTRIGIKADTDVKINRREVYEKIKETAHETHS